MTNLDLLQPFKAALLRSIWQLGPGRPAVRTSAQIAAVLLLSLLTASCGMKDDPDQPVDNSTVHERAITALEQHALAELGLTGPAELVQFDVDRALQNGKFVDAAGKTFVFCWEGRWSPLLQGREQGFYCGQCPPKQTTHDLAKERAIVVLAAVAIRRTLTCSQIQLIWEYQQRNDHGFPYTRLGSQAWASRLLWLSTVPRYSVAGRILDCAAFYEPPRFKPSDE